MDWNNAVTIRDCAALPRVENVTRRRESSSGPTELKELVVSCPDATGLGVDVTRVILEFGLQIFHADLMTDGGWAFLVFRLAITDDKGVEPRWSLLKQKITAICPSDTDALLAMCHIAKNVSEPFVVKISGYDRHGMLHRITQSFWSSDCSVFKSQVLTGEDGNVMDMFWIHDNKGLLPDAERAQDISDRLVKLLGDDVECSIVPAPLATKVVPKNISAIFGSGYENTDGNERLRRLACKDATSHSNLRQLIIGGKAQAMKHWSSSDSLSSHGSLDVIAHTEALSNSNTSTSSRHRRVSSILSPVGHVQSSTLTKEFDTVDLVSVHVDTATSHEFILIQVECHNRKGLLYDIFVQLKEIRVRVANCRVINLRHSKVRVELMVQDAYGGDLCSGDDSALILEYQIKEAVAKSVSILVGNGNRTGQYSVMVVAMIDAGGRGRPRVTYDVTKLLSSLGLSVISCDVFVEEGLTDEDESFEVHKYLIQPTCKSLVLTAHDREALTNAIALCLQGNFDGNSLEFEYESLDTNENHGVFSADILKGDETLKSQALPEALSTC